jgi:hypothetical protein
MAPALFIELYTHTCRWPRGIIPVARVTAHARHSGGATAAGVVAIPRSFRVAFANPATVLAKGAFDLHANSSAPAWVNFT